MMALDIDPEKVLHTPFLVGALGSLVGLRFAPGLSWWERLANVAAGSACAGVLAPAVGDWLHATAPLQSALAFVVGLFGLSLAAAVMQGLRDLKVGDILSGWLSRRQ